MRGQEGASLLFWDENYRITEWLGLERTAGDHPRQGHLQQVTQEQIQVGLECLQRGTLQLQSSATLNGKKFFLILVL